MKKIPTIFERDWNGDRSLVTATPNPDCAWVFRGEGVPTRKYDGTAVMVSEGVLFVRYDAKNGKTPPEGFTPSQEPDDETGHWPGWVPAGDSPQYRWQRAIFEACKKDLPDGTYEACGPHFQGNPEKLPQDCFVRHGHMRFYDVPRAHKELAEWFKGKDIEGVVWHHPDGRMAKIKKKDFGLRRSD
jgi:hypothetical protein